MKEGRTGTEKLPTSDSHVDGEKGTKTIVYNTKREDEEKKKKEKRTQKRKESKRLKKYNSKKEEFFTINHIVKARPRMLFAWVHV